MCGDVVWCGVVGWDGMGWDVIHGDSSLFLPSLQPCYSCIKITIIITDVSTVIIVLVDIMNIVFFYCHPPVFITSRIYVHNRESSWVKKTFSTR
jgi:hypothetical protein